ncbi:spidroin-2-like isoform X15 [Struthio camelus]|uniref:spidroin-2-like isoform X15 n=1 Tax=Struthio camelus TaxID=8801 RepID=UPI0036041F33
MPAHQPSIDKMKGHFCFFFLFCGIFLPRILGFPQTSTSIDCDSLLPNYEAEPQTSVPPYIIAVSFDSFEPGNEIQVTLEALKEASFKGFHLQAREVEGDVPVGTFKITDQNTKGLDCHNVTNSAVSHANSDAKQKVTTTWIAPHDIRDLQFIATVVQDLEKFWVGVQSKTLTPTHSESVNGTGRSKRKIMIEIECAKRGGTYTPQSGCVLVGPSGSSRNSYTSGQSGVVYSISKSGCVPGGTADAYSRHACKDSASSYRPGLTYGQSVPASSSDSSKKVVVIANSNPFPPVRHTYPQLLGSSATKVIIQDGRRQHSSSYTYAQGYQPQGGSSYGQGGPSYSGSSSSSSYGQGYQPQGGSSYGQGYQPQGGSSYGQGGPSYSGSSSSSSYGQGYQPQGGSSYGQQGGYPSSDGSSGCGQGTSYDSNPCHQDGSQGGSQGGSYSSQNYGDSQSGSSSSQHYGGSQNYGGGQGGSSSSDSYSDNQDSQVSSDDNPNACDDNDTTYSANGQSSGCSNRKIVVARDTSHVLSKRDYDVQNGSSTSNGNHTNLQDGSFIATGGGSSSQGGCICPDGSSGIRQGAPGSSHSTYSGNQGGSSFYPGGSSFYPGGSYGQGAPGSSHSTYSGNQGGPSFYPGGSHGQGAPGSSHSTYSGNQGGSSFYPGGSSFYPGGSYGQGAPGSSHSTYSGNQGGPSFYPGGSHGQGAPGSSHSTYSGNQGGPSFYPGGSHGQGESSVYDSSSESYGQDGPSTYDIGGPYGEDSPPVGGDESDESDSPTPSGSQHSGAASSSHGGSYSSRQDSSSSGSSQYGGQGSPSSGGGQSGGQGGCLCPGGSSGSSGGSSYHGGQGSSYSGSSQYGGQGSSSGGRPHGKPGLSSSGGSHQGKPGSSSSGSTYSGKQNSSSSGGSQVSSAGKHSSPGLLLLFSVLSAFAASAAVSKWSV